MGDHLLFGEQVLSLLGEQLLSVLGEQFLSNLGEQLLSLLGEQLLSLLGEQLLSIVELELISFKVKLQLHSLLGLKGSQLRSLSMLTWEVKVPGMSTNLSMEVVLSIILTGLSLKLSIYDRLYTLTSS